jgi:hypothetical protein
MKLFKKFISSPQTDIFLRNRSEEGARLIASDFDLLLQAWGIEKQEIPTVIRMLWIRALIYFAFFPVSLFIRIEDGGGLACGLVFLCGAIGEYVTLWRIRVLKTRRYIRTPGHTIMTKYFNRLEMGVRHGRS